MRFPSDSDLLSRLGLDPGVHHFLAVCNRKSTRFPRLKVHRAYRRERACYVMRARCDIEHSCDSRFVEQISFVVLYLVTRVLEGQSRKMMALAFLSIENGMRGAEALIAYNSVRIQNLV